MKDSPVIRAFAKRLKQLREEAGLTKAGLAKELGVNVNTITRWETGRCDVRARYLLRILDFFNVDCDYMLGATDYKK